MKHRLFFTLVVLAVCSFPVAAGASAYDSALAARLQGRILLQVESHGEAWYIRAKDLKRYYMKDGAAAYSVMRFFSLGIADSDLAKIPQVSDTTEMKASTSACTSNALANRLRGEILLQTQQHGEAWYVDPVKCRAIYLKDGDVAYQAMRFLGFGAFTRDLEKIEDGGTVAGSVSSANPPPAQQPAANKRAVVIIYKNVYDALKPEIDNFQKDVSANLGVGINIIQLQDSSSYMPLDIRNLLIKECQLDGVNGCHDLEGAVLVGDIPYALYEQVYDSNHLAPFMYFYEDLDASFKQNNLGHYYGYDGYGAHGGPEIYTGWIRSTFPSTDFNNHINELRAYFQKHHNFFTKQSVPAKWAVSAVHVPYPAGYNHYLSIPNLGLTVYGTENSIDITPDVADNLAPFKPALMAELSKGPEVAYLHSHGGPTVVWDLTASDFSNLTNLPLFMLTWGCSNGNFIENVKDSIALAFINGKNLGLSFLAKLDSTDIDVYSGNCPDCGWFGGNQVNFFKYYNKGQYVGEAWLNVEHDFAALPLPTQIQTQTPTMTSSNVPLLAAPDSSASESSSGQLLDLYKLSGPLQRIIIGSPFIYSPTARK
ncbi:MAG: hypothetical protein WC641_01215 [Patescibacteria group bacterium]